MGGGSKGVMHTSTLNYKHYNSKPHPPTPASTDMDDQNYDLFANRFHSGPNSMIRGYDSDFYGQIASGGGPPPTPQNNMSDYNDFCPDENGHDEDEDIFDDEDDEEESRFLRDYHDPPPSRNPAFVMEVTGDRLSSVLRRVMAAPAGAAPGTTHEMAVW